MGAGFSRRETLIGTLFAALAAGTAHAAPAARDAAGRPLPGPLRLWYDAPAGEWVEALPIGNGRLGAMVFGGIAEDRYQLNEDTLWSGGPYVADNPDALAALPEVRRLVFEGRYAEAEAIAQTRIMGRPLRQMAYQPMGDLRLAFPGAGTASDYRRELDLDAATAGVAYRADGASHRREAFVSAADQVLVVRLTAEGGDGIDVDVRLDGTAPFQRPPPDFVGGPAPFKPHEPPEAEANRFAGSHRWTCVADDDGEILLGGRNSDHNGIAGALTFAGRARVLADGGTRRADGGTVSVRGARTVTILLAGATSYRAPKDTGGDPAAATRRTIAAAARKSFATLRDAHFDAHRALFRRVSIALGTTPPPDVPTGARIGNSLRTFDPDLAALYFQYARYLLISSSRPGTQPANLQGIWNDQLNPPWGSKLTININAQMNYWPAEPAGLPECTGPLIDMIEELAVPGAVTARTCYGARGWVAHHNTDIWRATAPCDGAEWGLWPTGAAWLCLHLWDRWDYGRDRAVLERAYPLMKGAALFFLDTLVRDPESGWLVTNPSKSPENTHPEGAVLCHGPTMDSQIIRDLFTNTTAAAELLDVDAGLRAEIAAARDRLVPNQIGRAGQLQEWIKDWDLEAPEINHRHVAHLYGLHPSHQIDAIRTPELHAAARRSLEIRGDEATGWGIAWRILFWARLGDGDHAYRVLRSLLGPDRTYPNMFDAHPPFQIDGNFGGAAGIAELFLQSVGDEIRLLPALPGAWSDGAIRGLRARGGFHVDLAWSDGRLQEAVLTAPRGGRCALRYDGRLIRVEARPGRAVTVRPAGDGLVLS